MTKNPEVKATTYLEIIVDRFEVIFETPEIGEWHTFVRKVNKTKALVGYVEYKVPFGNDFQMDYKLLKKQGMRHFTGTG
jgi:hypothetical protein